MRRRRDMGPSSPLHVVACCTLHRRPGDEFGLEAFRDLGKREEEGWGCKEAGMVDVGF